MPSIESSPVARAGKRSAKHNDLPLARGKQSAMPRGEIFDVHEAAIFLKLSPATVRTALAAQRLPGKRIGKEWRLSRTALIAWLSEPGERKNYPRRSTKET